MDLPQPSPTHRGDILVVDDTPENLALLAAMLKGRAYHVRAVPSGALALRAAQAEAPDLVLLDISMPELDGYEVCRRLKADPALREIPVIFLSALSETFDKVKAFQAGGVDYVTKPFKVEEMAARIETHLSLRRLRLDLEQRNQELARSYGRLEALEQARQALVQMVVHDLKSPLACIQLSADLLRQDAGLVGEHLQSLEDVRSMSRVMNRMVLDVLDVARTDQAGLRASLAPLDVRGLLADLSHEVRGLAGRARKSLAVEVDGGLPELVSADRDLVRRLLLNLLDNSIKYAPRDSQVSLVARPAGPAGWRLEVRDTGRGIPEAHRQRIFEPYARLERDLDQSAGVSRGLGLAFCRMAAEAHGGRIWVEENRPQGSAFLVELPLDPRAAPAIRPAEAAPAP
ncbi:MAG: hybrid sensor histidine kinase/response regulator [Anaeromyxobacter sp.]|nr:hybrid sensor histidine kinase/response regulator [Anaeromyxobacter sp.]MBL0276701.1 hybrid sensor histidine kinase/response regulator [Anaeromyxobacter sp.]